MAVSEFRLLYLEWRGRRVKKKGNTKTRDVMAFVFLSNPSLGRLDLSFSLIISLTPFSFFFLFPYPFLVRLGRPSSKKT